MQAAKEFEEKVANPIADATQEASGLNAEQINRCSTPLHASSLVASQLLPVLPCPVCSAP